MPTTHEPAADDLVIGYDFGTSSLKAALVDRAGHIVASAGEPYPLQLPQPGHAEQHPQDWWRAMRTVTLRLLEQAAGTRIRGLGLTAQMAGFVDVCLTAVATSTATALAGLEVGFDL